MHGHFAVLNSSRFYESSKYFQTLIFFLEILQIGNCLHRQRHALVLNASPFVFLKFPWILSLVRLSLWHSISLFNSTVIFLASGNAVSLLSSLPYLDVHVLFNFIPYQLRMQQITDNICILAKSYVLLFLLRFFSLLLRNNL